MPMAGFTDPELTVIALQANGIRAGEIARLLGCSRDALYAVVSGVYAKTGLKNAPELTRWAMQWGLDEMPELMASRRFR
jgi:DNA-binding CsgD family transcriptional regulator